MRLTLPKINRTSLSFQLISWYTSLVIITYLLFGFYAYLSLKEYLTNNYLEVFSHRAQQIGDTLLVEIDHKGLDYVREELHVRYSPEYNNRLLRVSDNHGQILYQSGSPKDASFDPADLPPPHFSTAGSSLSEMSMANGEELLIFAMPYETMGQHYLIEIGVAEDSIWASLRGLLLTLAFGLPAMAVLAVGGGYLLVRRAITPVTDIMKAAEDISQQHTGYRLPVPDTGDEIHQLTLALNRMLARLESALMQARRFSSDASHELRTPLTIIRGGLENIMETHEMSENARDGLGGIMEEVDRLSKITEGLLSISRFEGGEPALHKERFDLGALAVSTLEQIRPLAEDKQIRMVFEGEESVLFTADRIRIKQMLVNLLDNAIKYTQEGGMIILRLQSLANGGLLLEVQDTGIGIPARDLPHVFDRFYRVDKVRSREIGGVGLGLSIVRSICQAHDFALDVKSAEQRGTTFSIRMAG